jgi:hypothetical protein
MSSIGPMEIAIIAAIVICVGVLVVVAIGVGVYLYTRRSGSKDDSAG